MVFCFEIICGRSSVYRIPVKGVILGNICGRYYIFEGLWIIFGMWITWWRSSIQDISSGSLEIVEGRLKVFYFKTISWLYYVCGVHVEDLLLKIVCLWIPCGRSTIFEIGLWTVKRASLDSYSACGLHLQGLLSVKYLSKNNCGLNVECILYLFSKSQN